MVSEAVLLIDVQKLEYSIVSEIVLWRCVMSSRKGGDDWLAKLYTNACDAIHGICTVK